MPTFLERASQAIRQAGGRMTEQRYILLDIIANADQQLDAERLLEIAKHRVSGINLTTIYRTLNVLEATGLVQAHYHSPDHTRKFYELQRAEPTYHFTCRQCKQVIAFHSTLTETIRQQLAEQLGLSVRDVCICADGLCHACQLALAERETKP